ncbi:hypothetical protein [Lysobacter sp. Root690]|uniref:hypothetical protein n=1 Tax=Lysobacter sp. Root690 TaxID=1736588 RepID=UPI0006FAF88B|nr:hypothetical protein [Lysobacter sp. Root690]KRB06979.1 hypothetical protein ASD86_13410 [Lysobacter sp. Root690]
MNQTDIARRSRPWQVDALLVVDPVFDGDGHLHAWARLPESTWRDLAAILAARYDRIGFSNHRAAHDSADGGFAECGIARVLELSAAETMRDVELDGERFDLEVCEFSAYTAYLLGLTDFNRWHATDAELASDELCFFREGRIELMAQPWNSMLRFFAVEVGLLQDVQAAHPRFRDALFMVENGRLRGV